MLPIAITKPILEYADHELKDLNLSIEPEVVSIQETGNDITKDSDSKALFLNS